VNKKNTSANGAQGKRTETSVRAPNIRIFRKILRKKTAFERAAGA
jgi:hypothetical protein